MASLQPWFLFHSSLLQVPFLIRNILIFLFARQALILMDEFCETGTFSLAGTFKIFCCFVTKLLCFSSNLSHLAHFFLVSNVKTSHKLDRLYCLKLIGEVSNLFTSVLHGTLWLISFSDDTVQLPH